MQKCVAAFFLTLMVLSTTQLYQVVKLPALVTHYMQHKKTDGLSLMDFLCMHYVQATEKDDDWQDDMKLPFKSSAFNMTHTIDLFRQDHSIKITRPVVPVPVKENYPQLSYTLANYHADIWQPPRHIHS